MKHILYLLLPVFLFSCTPSEKEEASLLLFNAKIYTVDETFSTAEAMVIKDGKIHELGNSRKLMDKYNFKERFDAGGRFIYPGFIDPHCHFYGFGKNLFRVDVSATNSFEEVIERINAWHKEHPDKWIVGRGWDQNTWPEKVYPDKRKLDEFFPDIPVILQRIDGHAVIANSEALRIAGITASTKIPGGMVETFPGTNETSGILIDNAADVMLAKVPAISLSQQAEALILAQKKCFEVGLTTVSDAGLDRNIIELIDSLQKAEQLQMRVYAMISAFPENLDYYLSKGPSKTDLLNVCSFKFYGDGSLGSRGALMLEPFTDKPGHYGLMINEPGFYREYAQKLYDKGFQMNTHCIGDSAVRMMLNIYGEVLKTVNDKRWRIEHAQVVHPNDVALFAKYTVVPSMQATHATSDMYWAEERLGPERIKNAYALKTLMKQNGFIVNGSDFPVESINPLYGFYAAVARKDLKGFPEAGFQMENALSREEALKAMTIWAALSNFEEHEKGSIEVGKFADFVILEKDIMTVEISEIPNIKTIATYINGRKVY
ncbi:MAG: amidohydrolase [Bacteroidetes bacterium]|nr:amidohydrolase [Bacteroidota bacterium]